ncbi:uncharacterized protein PAC_17117 [Phialocephala subalpina]|uniref:2EXR domain-containing protein n=1 Tax=Phialocephala subalpina TaxID=576137 RepID=A0A1L7XQH7_9HELO|nr:uncharacterized protein PAC_17117 [Phialocephala subalpina]
MSNNTALNMPVKMFTCFPKLPLEIRNMIWAEAAKVPRNVDVWSPTFGTMTLTSDTSDERVVVTPYRFISKQTPPGILHTNQESRAISLKHFHLAFGNDFDGEGLGFSFEPTIMCGKDDRICPMGPYTETSQVELFICNTPSSYALNVWHQRNSPSPIEDFSYVMEFPMEILLYYHKKPIKGRFEFVDILDLKAECSELAWRLLVDGRSRIRKHHERVATQWEANRRVGYDREGKEASKNIELPEKLICPEIKLVKVVMVD